MSTIRPGASDAGRKEHETTIWIAALAWALIACPAAAWFYWFEIQESDAVFIVLPSVLGAIGGLIARRSVGSILALAVLAAAATGLSLFVLIAWMGSRGAFD